jgi:hypothetical protein
MKSFNWITNETKAGRTMLEELGYSKGDQICLQTCEAYIGNYIKKISPLQLIEVCRKNNYRAQRWGKYLPTLA